MSQQLYADAEKGARFERDEQQLQDENAQINALMNEPFVQRVQIFLQTTLEKLKHNKEAQNRFLAQCRAFDQMDENSYEEPLKEIFNIVVGLDPLTQIFIDLLPENFSQRIFPKVEDSMVKHFDKEVKVRTTVETFDAYVQTTLDYADKELTTEQFRAKLTKLFHGIPSILELLPVFFSEIDESSQQGHHQPVMTAGVDLDTATAAQPATQAIRPSAHNRAAHSKSAVVQSQHDTQQAATSVAEPEAVEAAGATQIVGQVAEQLKKTGARQTAPTQQRQLMTPIPVSLQKFPKVDVNFFLDRVPDMLKDRTQMNYFASMFALYLDGVLSQCEFFSLIQDMMDLPAQEEHFKQLQTMLAQRDNSRRDALDAGQFKLSNMLTRSYYIFSDDYVSPICSGRFKPGEHAHHVLNDKFSIKTSGTEDYKFKIKNVHEDNLFKNEDEMYAIDHQILQFARVIKKLDEEEKLARQQRASTPAGTIYEPQILTSQHYSFIQRFYEEALHQTLNMKKMRKQIGHHSFELINAWKLRFESHLQDLKQEKADKIADWKAICEANFTKSLDHRSFFFKKEQRELLPVKKQLAELERIANTPLSEKSLCQLKGGSSPQHEFYCTYTSFKIKHIQVYTQEDLEAPSLVNDYPINLRSPEAMTRNPGALPHMRFLLADKQMLELAFVILICGPSVGSNITVAEKSKIEDCLELFVSKYFRCQHSFKQLRGAHKQIQLLSEEEIALLSKKPLDYYRAKVEDNFKFRTWGEESAEQEDALSLELPFMKEEANLDENESNGGGEKEQSNSCSQNSSSQSSQARVGDMKQQINLLEGDQIDSQDGGATAIKDQGLLEPAFKEGYSLIFGTHHFYSVFKTIASIYERLVKAKQLVSAKVDSDLERDEIKAVVNKEGQELATFKQKAKVERFKLFVNALVGTLSQTPQKKLDPANYEDITRTLMGDQAYLLFVFDKLIMQTLKNLPALKTSDECQKNLALYQKFAKLPAKTQNEHLYLTQFQRNMQSVNNFDGTSIRLLYSPQSGVLCLHMFNLSPFTGLTSSNNGTHTLLSFRQIDSQKSKNVRRNMYKPKRKSQQQKIESSSSEDKINKAAEDTASFEEGSSLQVPVFLNRNRRKMKQIRKHLVQPEDATVAEKKGGELIIENGLVMRQVPLIRKLQFDPFTSDFMIYKRRKTELSEVATEEQRVAQNYATQLKLQKVMAEFRKKQETLQTSDEYVSEEQRMNSEEIGDQELFNQVNKEENKNRFRESGTGSEKRPNSEQIKKEGDGGDIEMKAEGVAATAVAEAAIPNNDDKSAQQKGSAAEEVEEASKK